MKTNFFQVILLLLILGGCVKDEEPNIDITYNGNYSFTATLESKNITRTTVDVNKNMVWMRDDKLGIYGKNTDNAVFLTSKFQENSISTEFTGKLSAPDDEAAWAYYPYDNNAETNEEKNSLLIHLPSEYTYTGNIYAPMLGKKTSDGQFFFKHLCGLLHVTLKNIPADARTFVIRSVGENAPAIAGIALVSNVNKAEADLSIQGEGGKNITYHLGSLEADINTLAFFIPLPTGTYPDLEISVLKADGTDYFTRSLEQQIIRRAAIIEVPVLDFNTGQSFSLKETTKEITEEMEQFVSISSIDQSTGITMLTYTDIDESKMLKVGDVLLKASMSDKFPRGFLGKVLSVEKKDNSYNVKTSPAALDEAFSQLYVNETVDLVPEGTPVTRAADEDGFFCFTLPLELKNGKGITVSGSCIMGLKFTSLIDIENKIMSYTIQDKIEVIGKIGVSGKLEGDLVKQEFKTLKLPSFQAGPLIVTPELEPSLIFRSTGEIEMMAEIKFKHINVGGAECIDGKWNSGRRPLTPNSSSPWDLGGNFTFKGSLFSGIAASLNASLYHLNDLFNMGFEVRFGPEISGELDLAKLMTVTEKEELLSAASLNTRFVLSGDFKISANILSWQAESSFPLVEVPFGERTLRVIPQVQKPEASITQKEGTGYQAQVKTRISEQLLTKKTTMKIALADKKGEVLKHGSSIEYRGESKGDEIPEVELDANFNDLESDAEYQSYPIVESPLVGNGGLELKSKNISFKTGGSTLREQLIKLYNDTNGKNWKKNKNWCSEEPIENWYGVYKNDEGKYTLGLSENNLQGKVSLSHEDLLYVALYGNKLTSLSLSGCKNLQSFTATGNPLEELKVVGCKNMEDCYFYKEDIRVIDISDSNLVLKESDLFIKLKNFIAQNRTDLTSLILVSDLDTLDVSGCTNLKEIQTFGHNIYKTIRYLDLSQCNALPKGYLLREVFEYPYENMALEYLDISNCTNEEGLAYSSYYEDGSWSSLNLPRNLKVLHANNCQSLHHLYIRSSMRTLEIKNCEHLKELFCPEAQLSILDLEGCKSLKYLDCNDNQLTALNLAPCAESLENLSFGSNRITIIDLSQCHNLKELQCNSNPISELNLSQCNKLEHLNCIATAISKLDITPCRMLQSLHVDNNRLKELNLRNCTESLQYLSCSKNLLTFLDIKDCINLKGLDCSENQLQDLYFNDCLKLQKVECQNNNLNKIDLSNHLQLHTVNCLNNPQLLSLNLSGCENLSEFSFNTFDSNCNSNLTVDVSGCNSLEESWFDWNLEHGRFKSLNASNHKRIKEIFVFTGGLLLPSVNFSECTSLEYVNIGKMESANFSGCSQLKDLYCTVLSELNLKGCYNLFKLDCSGSEFASLDVSDCTVLEHFRCDDNMSLVELKLPTNMKFYKEFYCWKTRITKEIPNWFPDSWYPTTYEQRYIYRETGYGIEVEVIDRGYGWWYPGEPGKKRHSRY